MTSKVTYIGGLRTNCEHMRSGSAFITDAPLDPHGLGEAFYPTDTIATALARCMFSVIGIKTRHLELNLENSTAEVTKNMKTEPRRISKVDNKFQMPHIISDKHRKILERPVHYSLHPDIVRNITFQWGL